MPLKIELLIKCLEMAMNVYRNSSNHTILKFEMVEWLGAFVTEIKAKV